MGKIKIVKDFLPHPKELTLKEDITKVTLLLSENSIDCFKHKARNAEIHIKHDS
jgi:hypothetical protein